MPVGRSCVKMRSIVAVRWSSKRNWPARPWVSSVWGGRDAGRQEHTRELGIEWKLGLFAQDPKVNATADE